MVETKYTQGEKIFMQRCYYISSFEQNAETILRRFALIFLKQESSARRSIQGKRLLAGWDEVYLYKVLFKLI
jgi:hypothetical protein